VRTEHQSRNRREMFETVLASGDKSGQLRGAAFRWPDDFAAVVYRALTAFQGSSARQIVDVVAQSGCMPLLSKQISGANTNRAVRAVRILSEIGDERSVQLVEGALNHPSSLVRVAAKRAILATAGKDSRQHILHQMPSAPLWERIVLYDCIAMRPELVEDFLGYAFSSERDPLILSGLELVVTLQKLTTSYLPEEVAQSQNVEIRIKLYKALPYLRVKVPVQDMLRNGLEDSDWRVRAMAAQACGQLNVISLTPLLMHLCQNFSNPAEAAHAGRALALFGGSARAQLEALVIAGTAASRHVATEVIEADLIKRHNRA
jgi:HEAT repeat protein